MATITRLDKTFTVKDKDNRPVVNKDGTKRTRTEFFEVPLPDNATECDEMYGEGSANYAMREQSLKVQARAGYSRLRTGKDKHSPEAAAKLMLTEWKASTGDNRATTPEQRFMKQADKDLANGKITAEQHAAIAAVFASKAA